MAVGAAYAKHVRVRTSSGIGTSADNIGGLTSANFNRLRDLLEKTAFGDSGVASFVPGVKGTEIPLEGSYDSADAPQGRLLTGYDDGSSVWIVYLPDGTAGWMVECKVERFEVSGAVRDIEKFSSTLRATGAVAAAA